mgnify:CR=1 FL=1
MDIYIDFITGAALGIEYVDLEEEGKCLIVSLLIVQFCFNW